VGSVSEALFIFLTALYTFLDIPCLSLMYGGRGSQSTRQNSPG